MIDATFRGGVYESEWVPRRPSRYLCLAPRDRRTLRTRAILSEHDQKNANPKMKLLFFKPFFVLRKLHHFSLLACVHLPLAGATREKNNGSFGGDARSL